MEISEVNVTNAADPDLAPPPPPPPPLPKPEDEGANASATAPSTAKGAGSFCSSSGSVLHKRPRSPSPVECSASASSAQKRSRTSLKGASVSSSSRKATAQRSSSSRKRPMEAHVSGRKAQKAKGVSSVFTDGGGGEMVSTPPRKVKSAPSEFRVPREQPRRSSLSRSLARTPARKMTIKQRPVFSTGGKLAAVRKLAHHSAGLPHPHHSGTATAGGAGGSRTSASSSSSSTVRSKRGAAAALKASHGASSGAGGGAGARRPGTRSPKCASQQRALRDDAVSHIERSENDVASDGGVDIYVPDELTQEFFHGKTFFVDGDCLEVVQLLWKLKARVAATFADPSLWAFIGRASLLLADEGQHQRPAFKYENARRMRAVVQTLNERKTNFQLAKEHGVPLLDYELVKQALGVLIPQVHLGGPKGSSLFTEPPFLWLCDTELEYKPEIKRYRLDSHDRPTLPTLYLDFSAPIMSPFLDNYPRDGRVVYLPPSGRKDVPRVGYCEICNRNYDRGMPEHVHSEYHMRKLRHTDFSNLDNLFKAIDAAEGRESSIVDVPPESPIEYEELSSGGGAASSPFAREVEVDMEVCAPALPAAQQQPPPLMATAAASSASASISHGRRPQGAFRSVLAPLAAAESTPRPHAPGTPTGANPEPTLAPASRGYFQQEHHQQLPARSPSSRSRASAGSTSQQHLSAQSPNSLASSGVVTRSRSRLAHATQQHARGATASTNSTQLKDTPEKNGTGASASSIPPSTARSTSSSTTLLLARGDQNAALLPANLFHGTSSENARETFDLTPPSTEGAFNHVVGVVRVPQPTNGAELFEKRVAGSRVTGRGPFGSLLRPGAPGVDFDAHESAASTDPGCRKGARNNAAEDEGAAEVESEPGLRSPSPTATMTKLQTATKGAARSPLSAPGGPAPSKPSDTTPSFPSPPSFASIKRKRGSPLPSIMLSGSTPLRRSPRVLQQRDKNTLCVPPVQAPAKTPPSGAKKPATHLKFSSSSPTGFYSKAAVPFPSSVAVPQGHHPAHPSFNGSGGAFSAPTPPTGAESSSEAVPFPLKPMQHHFTSSPVFKEALLSDASRRHSNGSGSRAPSSSRFAPRADSSAARAAPSAARRGVDENTWPRNHLLASAAAGNGGALDPNPSAATPACNGVATAPGALHVSAPPRSRDFKVASSSSSGLVSPPQHRKKRRRKDNRTLFRSSSVEDDHLEEGGGGGGTVAEGS